MESIFCFDLVILGNSNVGKSSLLSRYVYNNLPEQIQNTSGVEFLKKTIFEPQIVARLKIWDTAGQERFRNIIRTHYTNSEGALLDYDIHDRDSYNDAIKWAEELNDWV
ncbi:ras-related protein Rab-6-like [Drosophila ficusphila]|uniref:ras-related protein Rab-6-like n=1 Tax=Drosophila ficusphila TaxID=30025 RepID=UPI001C8ABD9C|nr:ras-related protein Rab-6-like [Drosophila ficusphila]